MRGDLNSSMMPVAPAATLPSHHSPVTSGKPKLGFSIESIVGPPSSKVHPSDHDETCSDGEVTAITPPPAHNHHKITVPPSTSPSYYRNEDLYSSYGPYGPQRIISSPKMSDYRNELVMSGHTPPSALAYPSVMSPYGSPLPLGHCHGQYPLASYLVNRDYASYPWLMARQPRILPYRPQGPPGGAAGFILHQFRKPKRIRTAFSPSQLLTLEHAFEKNHYVVGTERKQLAQNLNLTETQVKVWFQNRRTKHKRQKQEEEGTSNPMDDQSASKSDTGSENGRPPSSYSPPIEESDVSDCEDDEDCESPSDYARHENS